jgi:hypothetical protein
MIRKPVRLMARRGLGLPIREAALGAVMGWAGRPLLPLPVSKGRKL